MLGTGVKEKKGEGGCFYILNGGGSQRVNMISIGPQPEDNGPKQGGSLPRMSPIDIKQSTRRR